jgi:uracil-DNA glycosylase family 4
MNAPIANHGATGDLFQAILDGSKSVELDTQFPFYGLDAPGMPLPGADFIRAAERHGENPAVLLEGKGKAKHVSYCSPMLHYLYRRALYDEMFQLYIDVKNRPVATRFLPGHLFPDDVRNFNGGPRATTKVMVIGKHPGQEEMGRQRNFTGPTSEELFRALSDLDVTPADLDEWYFTNLVKFPQLDRNSDGLPKAWIQDCLPLLHEEIRLCQPDYILCLGSHASKALLGTWAAVSNMTGRVEQITVPIGQDIDNPCYKEIKVMTATHPAAVYRRTELYEPFKDQLGLFLRLTEGQDVGGVEQDVDHRIVYSERELTRYVDAVRADPTRWLISVDCEWHGRSPIEPNAFLRTVQISTKHGEGICVVLHYQGGRPAFTPSRQHAIEQLKRLLISDPEAGYYPRVGGHLLRRDIPWLLSVGIDCRNEFAAPDSPTKMRTEGGWDSTLAYHATNEAASFTLTDMSARLTTVPRYDTGVATWKAAYCQLHKIKLKELEGYGMCPDWVLLPYGAYDPDAARRCYMRCATEGGFLDSDWFGNNSWSAYWVAHRASLGFLEMEMNGITLDRDRVAQLSQSFVAARDKLTEDFRRRINWPTFNPESNQQCAAFLFGGRFAYKMKGGDRVPIPPEGARLCNFTPIKTTGTRSKDWQHIIRRGEEDQWTPSTDKEVLGILGHGDDEGNKLVMQLRDIKFISQALKSVLRPPEVDDDGVLLVDTAGNPIYSAGLASYAQADGKLHTRLSQLKETGRASSAAPPLQNLSKRREDDFMRILGVRGGDGAYAGTYEHVLGRPYYLYPTRTILRAAEGCVLVECDLQGAELAGLAWLAGDPVMIDHVERGKLPEDHPDHYDIHSQMAVAAFGLTCPATKTGLKKAGKKGLRVAAKNVNFGIPYGRGALAISRQCREEGVVISVEDTQRLIDMYFEKYQQTIRFIQECQVRVEDPQWLTTAFLRYRRFIRAFDKSVLGEQQRQAQNFPIQGTVADAISRAVDELCRYRAEHPEIQFRMLLQIHDAILFEVPIPYLSRFCNEVLPECMVNRIPVWPRRLDGTLPEGAEPCYFGIDTEVQINWGEDISEQRAREMGIDVALI